MVKDRKDEEILQRDLDSLSEWSDTWLLRFHPGKCKHMRIGKSEEERQLIYNLRNSELEQINQEKDIGVLIDEC